MVYGQVRPPTPPPEHTAQPRPRAPGHSPRQWPAPVRPKRRQTCPNTDAQNRQRKHGENIRRVKTRRQQARQGKIQRQPAPGQASDRQQTLPIRERPPVPISRLARAPHPISCLKIPHRPPKRPLMHFPQSRWSGCDRPARSVPPLPSPARRCNQRPRARHRDAVSVPG